METIKEVMSSKGHLEVLGTLSEDEGGESENEEGNSTREDGEGSESEENSSKCRDEEEDEDEGECNGGSESRGEEGSAVTVRH